MTASDRQLIVGVIGCGNLGSVLVRGLVTSPEFGPSQLLLNNREQKPVERLADETGARIVGEQGRLAAEADVVVIAVKPADVATVCASIMAAEAAALQNTLIISVAAGVPLKLLAAKLFADARVARVMPNLPSQIGQGIAGVYAANTTDAEIAERVFAPLGKTVRLAKEEQLDVVTGLSGSGPAFVFLMIEALIEAGVQMGLPAEQARQLSIQTVLGAARLVDETNSPPAELRTQVTSPQGTTFAGLEVLRERDFSKAVIAAVEAATKRARELAG